MKRGATLLLPLFAGLSHYAHAQGAQTAPPQPTSVWLYSLYKAITYETAANLADIPLYSTVLAGAQAAGALFNTVNFATALTAYYVYEVGWNLYGQPPDDTPSSLVGTEIGKTLLYRVVSSARNVALAYFFTGSYAATLGFVVISNVTDTLIYAANEYSWYRYGPPVATVWGEGVSLQDLVAGLRPGSAKPVLATTQGR